jgi:hypothetical protein
MNRLAILRPAGVAVALLACLVLPSLGSAAVPHPDDDAVRGALQKVLDRPEFSGRATPAETWLQRALRAILVWLGGLRLGAPLLFWLLVCGCGVGLTLLVSFLARRLRGRAAGEEDARAAADARRQRLSQRYRDEAGLRAERGEFTEAIRCLFLSLVYRFDESGRVLFPRAYTNREYLTLFADRPGVAGGLQVLVDTLDVHWYGEQPSGREQYEECRGLYDELSRRG